jgi:hypothetical protein
LVSFLYHLVVEVGLTVLKEEQSIEAAPLDQPQLDRIAVVVLDELIELEGLIVDVSLFIIAVLLLFSLPH